jgi:DNA polymerase-3 subunit beta
MNTKIIISKSQLESAVKNICKVINTKNALPILSDIYFKCDKDANTIQAMGSDSDVWLTYNLVPNELGENTDFCVDAELLKNALANLPDQLLEIYVQMGGEFQNMSINHQTGHTIIPVESAENYPKPIAIDKKNLPFLSVQVQTLQQPVKRSMYALAADELRPIMGCLMFDKAGDHLNIVASNGHVLIKNEERTEQIQVQQDISFIMHKKPATILAAIMDKLDIDDNIIFHVDERQVMIASSGVTLHYRMIEGKYPNYDSVLPVGQPYNMKVYRQQLLNAIKNVSPFTNSSSNMVVLRIEANAEDPDHDALTIMGSDYDFGISATDTISVKTNLTDQYMNIGMKASTLIDSLARLAESEVEIKFSEPMRAITITPVDPHVKEETITMLVMPMLINDSDK